MSADSIMMTQLRQCAVALFLSALVISSEEKISERVGNHLMEDGAGDHVDPVGRCWWGEQMAQPLPGAKNLGKKE